MSDVQRLRVLAAMAEVVGERGFASITVAHVVSRAGVSRRTFYDLFEDRQECFLAAFDEAVAQAAAAAERACRAERRWVDRVRAGLRELLVFLDEQPALARLCVVEALAAGPMVLERRGVVLARLAEVVEGGRVDGRRKTPPPLTAEGIVGAVFSVIHSRLTAPDHAGAADGEPLAGLLGALMALIVLPYLGAPAASRELARPIPTDSLAAAVPSKHQGHPLRDLRMRVTYRTLKVLAVIAEHPGASNRDVAERAEVVDQGQMSKLLTRLERLGLIHNTGEGHTKGAPNAWRLTPRGADLHETMAVQSKPSASTSTKGA